VSAVAAEARGPVPFRLDAYLASEVARIEAALHEIIEAVPQDAPAALHSALLYALGTRGKRIRPVLCLAAYRAIRALDPPDAAYGLACALELVHTYSLVHDDLPCMDDDDLRRGRPTVHRVYGSAAALLAAAALLPMAVGALEHHAAAIGLNVAERARLVVELCRAAGAEGMVGGQFLDLEAEAAAIDGGQLESIHRAKTGALLTASLRIGGIAAGGEDRRLSALTAYGERLGLAFQIADDILDVTVDSASLGKTAGKDVVARKATYPALFGVEGARELANRRVEEAIAALEGAGVQSAPLIALARYVVERRK
jgi:geranylgeranyl diphosphate synthase, type II